MLALLQARLQAIYGVDLDVAIEDFTIGARELAELRARGACGTDAEEQLLVLEEEDETSLALFIADGVLERLGRSDPLSCLTAENLADFCLLAEGVSHFVYYSWKTSRGEPVTQLELELQAEVDKYVTCFLARWEQDRGRFPDALKEALFRRVGFRPDLGAEEADRYRTANGLALRYCGFLERSFLRCGEVPRAMPELRRFYRLSHAGKLAHIAVREP